MKYPIRLLTVLAVLSLGSFAFAGNPDKKAEPACGCGAACKCTDGGKDCTCKHDKKADKKEKKEKKEKKDKES